MLAKCGKTQPHVATCSHSKQHMAKCMGFVALLWRPRLSRIYVYIYIYIYIYLFIHLFIYTPTGSRRHRTSPPKAQSSEGAGQFELPQKRLRIEILDTVGSSCSIDNCLPTLNTRISSKNSNWEIWARWFPTGLLRAVLRDDGGGGENPKDTITYYNIYYPHNTIYRRLLRFPWKYKWEFKFAKTTRVQVVYGQFS